MIPKLSEETIGKRKELIEEAAGELFIRQSWIRLYLTMAVSPDFVKTEGGTADR